MFFHGQVPAHAECSQLSDHPPTPLEHQHDLEPDPKQHIWHSHDPDNWQRWQDEVCLQPLRAPGLAAGTRSYLMGRLPAEWALSPSL